MRGAVPVAVVELDAVGGGAAEESGVEQVGAPCAAGHGNAAAGRAGGDHGFRAGRDIASGARDHHPDGVEQVAPRVVPHLVRQTRRNAARWRNPTMASVAPAAGCRV